MIAGLRCRPARRVLGRVVLVTTLLLGTPTLCLPSTCSTPADCDDANPCTDDTCSSAGGSFVCDHTNNSEPCDDGNRCTVGDTCIGGSCVGDPNLQTCHFQCYELRPVREIHGLVRLEDEFGMFSGVAVQKAERLCAPASKNDEEPGAAAEPVHLEGYRIRPPGFVPRTNQRVVDEFGELRLDVIRPDRLMAPTHKSFGTPPPPVVDPQLDHFDCYKVRKTKGTPAFMPRTVEVRDQLRTASLTLKRPIRLCTPTNERGESPEAARHEPHLLCYRATAVPLGTLSPFVNNEFEAGQRSLIRQTEFCVPALHIDGDLTLSSVLTHSTGVRCCNDTLSTELLPKDGQPSVETFKKFKTSVTKSLTVDVEKGVLGLEVKFGTKISVKASSEGCISVESPDGTSSIYRNEQGAPLVSDANVKLEFTLGTEWGKEVGGGVGGGGDVNLILFKVKASVVTEVKREQANELGVKGKWKFTVAEVEAYFKRDRVYLSDLDTFFQQKLEEAKGLFETDLKNAVVSDGFRWMYQNADIPWATFEGLRGNGVPRTNEAGTKVFDGAWCYSRRYKWKQTLGFLAGEYVFQDRAEVVRTTMPDTDPMVREYQHGIGDWTKYEFHSCERVELEEKSCDLRYSHPQGRSMVGKAIRVFRDSRWQPFMDRVPRRSNE